MVFKNICIILLRSKVALSLKVLTQECLRLSILIHIELCLLPISFMVSRKDRYLNVALNIELVDKFILCFQILLNWTGPF